LTATRGDGAVVEPGVWLAAPAAAAVPLLFSDGSLIELAPSSGARIVRTDARGARVLLEKGKVRADIVHRPDTSWRLDVGPYEVRVTGTKFDASWEPDRQEFAFDLHEGGVEVRGPMVQGGQRLAAGHSFRAWLGEKRVELLELEAGRTVAEVAVEGSGRREEPPAPEDGNQETAAEDRGETAAGHARNGHPAAEAARAEALPGPEGIARWKTLAAAGDYAGALMAADAAGFDGLLASCGPGDLLDLGDAARLAGDCERAERCYLEVRRRAGAASHAARAALALGRMAFDQQHLYSRAASWLDLYLRESGGGGLAREALGRLVEARHRAGDGPGALDAARAYLATYPDGPHAAYARKLVESADGGGGPP
jgi:hypothetical protein